MEIEETDLEEARKLFKEAEGLPKAAEIARKAAKEVGRATEARDKALAKHKEKIKAAGEAKVRAHAAVSVAQKAQAKIRDRFVPRQLILDHEQAAAKVRELEQGQREADKAVSMWQREIELLVEREDVGRAEKKKRRDGFDRRLIDAEATAARWRDEIAEARAVERAAEAKISAAIEAVYKLATAPAKAGPSA